MPISIHAPVWGATCCKYHRVNWWSNFNPRTRMGCDSRRKSSSKVLPHFNPRTRMGCDAATGEAIGLPEISIHAPVWGATSRRNFAVHDSNISIHAPVWGATIDIDKTKFDRLISIHAPVWGATHLITPFEVAFPYFNPRTRMGCDKIK